MQTRLRKARGAFTRLKTVWKSSPYRTTTKSCCTAQNAGELLRATWTRSASFTMDASGGYAVYLAYENPQRRTVQEDKERFKVWSLRSSVVKADGLEMFSEWTRIESQTLPWWGHHLAEENKVDLKQHGDAQWWHGKRCSTPQIIKLNGSKSLMPCVPLGTKSNMTSTWFNREIVKQIG